MRPQFLSFFGFQNQKKTKKLRDKAASDHLGNEQFTICSTYSSGSLGIDPDKPFRIPSQLRDNLAKFESEYQSEHLQLPVVIQGIDVSKLQKHVNGYVTSK